MCFTNSSSVAIVAIKRKRALKSDFANLEIQNQGATHRDDEERYRSLSDEEKHEDAVKSADTFRSLAETRSD